MTNDTEQDYFQKQLNVKNIGPQGMLKLKKASVLIIGAGGIGCSALQYLAGSGLGNIGICDFDWVNHSDLYRQIIYSHDQIGFNKAIASKEKMQKHNPWIKLTAFDSKITTNNITSITHNYQIIADCSDNFETKYLIHDHALKNNTILLSASNYQTQGQIFLFPQFHNGCLRCLWPTPPQICNSSNGPINFISGLTGIILASEIIKLILGHNTISHPQHIIMNLNENKIERLIWEKNPHCQLC